MVAIVGRPNVGKSSLFNRLVERERAIVTAAPGTTRDLVSETVSLGGIPVRLTDTAGLRASSDEAESIGIKKSYEALAEADLVLLVTECSNGGPSVGEDNQLLQVIGERRMATLRDLGSDPSVIRTEDETLAFVDRHRGEQPVQRGHCQLATHMRSMKSLLVMGIAVHTG